MKARHKKASGGKVYSDSEKVLNAGGNPNVIEEARERKHGGRTNKAEGDKPKKRLDKFRRGGRAMGGRTGADKHPLSSAARVSHIGSTDGIRR